MSNAEITELPTETWLPSSHQEAIETVISSMAQKDSAMVQTRDKTQTWKFQYGSVEVFVQLTGESDDDLLTVWASVLKLPVTDQLGLFEKLLSLNWQTTLETRFALAQDQIIVVYQRTVADLSPGEISRAITLVATIADDHDDLLKEQFGGQ
ncbi:MAG: YbjN domain-containing protein [Microcystaceae cyanobacterium]